MTIERDYRIKKVKHALGEDCRTIYINYQNKREQNPLRVKEKET